uniref:BEL1-like homeodomain protein 7 n=1 Tax=Erigeron canadensis TaxID=72917 RepID=UPI001CB92A7E|nr:BEL1-like homeodomain protein 7 [Erigeron canadensis]
MSSEIPSSENGRLKEPMQDCTMYTSEQTKISIDFPKVNIHNSCVVPQHELGEMQIKGNEFGFIKDCWSHEMLLRHQMDSHYPPTGIQFHLHQYENLNVDFPVFVEKSTQNSESYPYATGNVISDSKYRIPVQQLLDELVNVNKVKLHFKHESMSDSQEVFGESKNQQGTRSLSSAEKQNLKNKITKLSSMLNEVDRRYKQYSHQMQVIVSSFDVLAGCGAAKPYTSRALQTISSHFRCLRDAINNQIKVISRSLGDTDSNENEIVISRLRFVDQQLRKQNRVHQFGTMQEQVWRPQRGLPESCVSILRAWLFEHFLHPYPKDSEKTTLARQTGLTKSQVSNWFINARVRLWKPMVEGIYQEESAEAAMDSNSSSEIAPKESLLDQAQDMNQSAA